MLTLTQMYILAAVSQLNCLMALGIRQKKSRPADLLGILEDLLYCKWQRPPSPSPSTSLCPCSPLQPPLHAVSLSVGSEVRFPKRRPLTEPQAAGTLTSSNDLQVGLYICSSCTPYTTYRAILLNTIATSTVQSTGHLLSLQDDTASLAAFLYGTLYKTC